MPLNFSLQSDSVTGRRTFLIATAVSAISLLFQWYSGDHARHILFQEPFVTNYTISGLRAGGWITLLITAAVPMAYLIIKQGIPSQARKLSIGIISIVIVLILYGAWAGENQILINGALKSDSSVLMNGDTIDVTRQSGVARYLFVAAQIACCLAIARFPKQDPAIITIINAGN